MFSSDDQGTQPAPTPSSGVAKRRVGLGLGVGGFDLGIGPQVRVWSSGRLGFDGSLDYYSIGEGLPPYASYEFSVLTIRPGLLYGFNDDDDESVRFYVSAGPSISRSTSKLSILGDTESASATDVGGFAVFGAEVRFGEGDKFAFSGSLGYYTNADPFPGLRIGGFAYGASFHVFF